MRIDYGIARFFDYRAVMLRYRPSFDVLNAFMHVGRWLFTQHTERRKLCNTKQLATAMLFHSLAPPWWFNHIRFHVHWEIQEKNNDFASWSSTIFPSSITKPKLQTPFTIKINKHHEILVDYLYIYLLPEATQRTKAISKTTNRSFSCPRENLQLQFCYFRKHFVVY